MQGGVELVGHGRSLPRTAAAEPGWFGLGSVEPWAERRFVPGRRGRRAGPCRHPRMTPGRADGPASGPAGPAPVTVEPGAAETGGGPPDDHRPTTDSRPTEPIHASEPQRRPARRAGGGAGWSVSRRSSAGWPCPAAVCRSGRNGRAGRPRPRLRHPRPARRTRRSPRAKARRPRRPARRRRPRTRRPPRCRGGLTTIMPGHRVVAYYGDGSTDVLGTLGVGTPAQALDRLAAAGRRLRPARAAGDPGGRADHRDGRPPPGPGRQLQPPAPARHGGLLARAGASAPHAAGARHPTGPVPVHRICAPVRALPACSPT